jgi:LuxR family maltose regulon positive regulatory protein
MRVVLAALRLADADPEAAVDVLAPSVASTPVEGSAWEIKALLLEAIARDALRDPGAVSRALEAALDLAESGGLLLPFLLHPAPSLLERHSRLRSTHAALISEILNLLSGHAREPGTAMPRRSRNHSRRASFACCATCRPTCRRRRSPASCFSA